MASPNGPGLNSPESVESPGPSLDLSLPGPSKISPDPSPFQSPGFPTLKIQSPNAFGGSSSTSSLLDSGSQIIEIGNRTGSEITRLEASADCGTPALSSGVWEDIFQVPQLDTKSISEMPAISDPGMDPKKLDYFATDCTEITPFLHVGGEIVANSMESLQAKGITHILNAASRYVKCPFPDTFEYMPLYLRDDQGEDIICVFYDVFDFIDSARQKGGKVFVHCRRGISRSPGLCIAYLMCSRSQNWDDTGLS